MPKVLIQFDCETQRCDAIIEEMVDVSEPDFSAEKMSDGDAIEDHDLTCPECGTDYVVETVSSFGGVTANVGGRDINAEVQYEPDYDDYLLSYVPASDTEADYVAARDDLTDLLSAHGGAPDGILNRMIFSQVVAIMEAYLSDKILRLVKDHHEIKGRLISGADFLKDQKLGLAEVLSDPGKAEALFRLGLQKILYHDLPKVEKLYKIALKNDAFPADPELRKTLDAAIITRHDCVHRNGRRMDGSAHSIADSMIDALMRAVDKLVQHVELKAAESLSKFVPRPTLIPPGPPPRL
jgi:hypothetical protein